MHTERSFSELCIHVCIEVVNSNAVLGHTSDKVLNQIGAFLYGIIFQDQFMCYCIKNCLIKRAISETHRIYK